ncbi:hypothetical protein SAMN05216188_107105 [Lentzea xinjiangensis]|uniref:Uncharacterized protein n=1 Tax=Lentzea xinjiangensis TaxID=402600 RepID=A0A1H9KTX1_9PSEU|nr:hypothetical protein [Lentzea xinjiangensis]SER02243.1 hypothetical protein SAMN05216188_107105 [Lentzea xinjiangensis]
MQVVDDMTPEDLEVLNAPTGSAWWASASNIGCALAGPDNDAASISLGLEHAENCEIEASKT